MGFVMRRFGRFVLAAMFVAGFGVTMGGTGCGGTECRMNTDCRDKGDNLVCAFGYCTIECNGDPDCSDQGKICVNDTSGTGTSTVCLEPVQCNSTADCGEGWTCFNHQCRNGCASVPSCPTGQVCYEGACLLGDDARAHDKTDPNPDYCRGDAGTTCNQHSDCLSSLCGFDAKCARCGNHWDCYPWLCSVSEGKCFDPELGATNEACMPLDEAIAAAGGSSSSSSSSSSSGSTSSSSGATSSSSSSSSGSTSASSSSSSSGSSSGTSGISADCAECQDIDSTNPKSAFHEICAAADVACAEDPICTDLANSAFGVALDDDTSCAVHAVLTDYANNSGPIPNESLALFYAREKCVYCNACAALCDKWGTNYCDFLTNPDSFVCPAMP